MIVKSLDRLSRNNVDIRKKLQWFQDNKIPLKVIDLPTTMMDWPEGQEWIFDMVHNILMEVLGTIAESERLIIQQRQKEDIQVAKARDKHQGHLAIRRPEN